MIKKGLLICSVCSLLMAGCSTDHTGTDKNIPVSDSTSLTNAGSYDFNAYFNRILQTLRKKDKAELSKYVSPEFGLLVIRSDGALPSILIPKNDKTAYESSLDQLFASVPESVSLKDESLPRVDCGLPNFYTKTGHFMRDTNLLGGSDIWKFGGLNPEDQEFAEKVIQSTTRTVMLAPGITFFFSGQGNQWFLVLVDLRKPCAA